MLTAEAVLGVPAELVAEFNRIGLADSALAAPQAGFGEVEAYPDFPTKARLAPRRAASRRYWAPRHVFVREAERAELTSAVRSRGLPRLVLPPC